MTMTTRFVQRYGGMTTKGGDKADDLPVCG